jgi:hypothetical protein
MECYAGSFLLSLDWASSSRLCDARPLHSLASLRGKRILSISGGMGRQAGGEHVDHSGPINR